MRHWLFLLIIVSHVLRAGTDDKPIDLKLRDTAGEKVSLKAYAGHPVVVNFWATWCGPCQAEMPILVESEKKWAQQGVRFIAVSLDDKRSISNVQPFLNRFRVTFPVWVGANAAILDRLQLGNGVPDTLFLDEHGFVYARVLGEIHRAELDERLAWLLDGRKGHLAATLDNMKQTADR